MTLENYKKNLEHAKKVGRKVSKPEFNKSRAEVWEKVFGSSSKKKTSKKKKKSK